MFDSRKTHVLKGIAGERGEKKTLLLGRNNPGIAKHPKIRGRDPGAKWLRKGKKKDPTLLLGARKFVPFSWDAARLTVTKKREEGQGKAGRRRNPREGIPSEPDPPGDSRRKRGI